MLYTLVTSLVGGLQVFDIPYLLNGGGPNSGYSTTTITIFGYELRLYRREQLRRIRGFFRISTHYRGNMQRRAVQNHEREGKG